MNDQIPADVTPEDMAHARAYVQDYLDAAYAPDRTLAIARVLHALLPPPSRPTLADMTEEERRACQWMQCDVRGFQGQLVLATTCDDDDEAGLVAACGEVVWSSLGHVTPRTDLPRMTWPGEQQPAPALPGGWRLAEHPAYGRIVVTNPTPDVGGHVYFVSPAPSPIGNDWHTCDLAELTYTDQEAGDVTPALVGDTIESADDPRIDSLPVGSVLADSDGDEVVKRGEDWAGIGYIPFQADGGKFGPWTVRRIGQEGNQ